MNHNYPVDRSVLGRLLQNRPAYIGMLGPRMRTERILRELNVASAPDFLHAPVGLDIGGDTPESIALSIVAEIQTALSGRTAKMLRSVEKEIETGAESTEPIALCA
jgi:xanthine dehydrogenase accessory factor